ncbi:MAG: insulinase family protein [Holosporales bacterium]|jgi:zinc protease|nr:insulinase family protein [Holosporales bacterium]
MLSLSAISNTAKADHTSNKQDIEIFETALENGLKIIVVPLKSNGVIRVGIIYDVGCADDPMCKIGISHFLEHMMFKGTKNISMKKLNYLTKKYNSYVNAGTGDDFTFYHYILNKKFLDVDLKIEADRMVNLELNESDIVSERNVVAEERNMRCDANPTERYICDALPKILYLHSNYSYIGIGYPHHIKAYSRLSLKKHYDRFYAPNNATVLIVGDITQEEAFKKVEKTFKYIKKTHEINRQRVLDPKDLNIKYTMDRASKQVTTRNLSIYYTFDRSNVDTLKKYYTAKIAIDSLCGTSRSVMAKKFIDRENKVYSIDGDIILNAFDKAFVCIQASLRENTKMLDMEADIDNVVKNSPITKENFEANKKRILNNIDIMKDNPTEMFDYVLQNKVLKYSTDDIKNVKNIINSITFEDVKKFEENIINERNKTHRVYSHPEGVTA